jgi:hypothetical protein
MDYVTFIVGKRMLIEEDVFPDTRDLFHGESGRAVKAVGQTQRTGNHVSVHMGSNVVIRLCGPLLLPFKVEDGSWPGGVSAVETDHASLSRLGRRVGFRSA